MSELFSNTPVVNHDALVLIASRAIPRKELTGRYCNLAKSTDLFHVGYTVSHWIDPRKPGEEVLEYNPRLSELPRLTAASYDEQKAIHEALDIRVVDPGKEYRA